MDSIRPLQNYDGGIVPQAVLNGTLGTVVYASNYNDLDNKPSINSVELRGNKTAEDLGLATPADITVTSVNTQTGNVSLTGQNIPYDSTYSVTEKINDLESQIVDSGVSSVNGHTGAVILTGSDINYSVGVSLNAKIDAVEGEIPVVNYPVTSVNSKTGAVVLTGSDIDYSEGVSINTQIENVAGDLASLTAEDIPMSGSDSTLVSTAIGDLSQLTTTDKSSLVGAVNSMIIKSNASWIANSSSAYGTTLTDSINVTAGAWLITWGHPSQSATLGCFVDGISTNSDITDNFMSFDNGMSYTKGCILVRFTGNSTIKLCAGGSASVSFSNIERGFLRAVKLK